MKKTISQLVNQSSGVYVLPSVYAEFNKKLNDPNATNAQLADIIQFDAGLTGFLLKIVNSAFYGFSSSISSISHGISIIGRKELAILVLGKSVIDVFSKLNVPDKILMEHWEQSLRCGLYGKLLAKSIDETTHSPETLFVAGLIHGIGKLVIWNEYPELAKKYAESEVLIDYLKTEKQELGYCYFDVGAFLLKQWRLPEVLINVTKYHLASKQDKLDYSVNLIAFAKQIAHFEQGKKDKPLEEAINMQLALKLNLDEEKIKELIELCQQQWLDMRAMFLG